MTIRAFIDGDQPAFRRLNEEWITRYFAMEGKDEHSLEHPERTILEPGGRIYFACIEGEPVGCCAMMAIGPGEFEVAKMAVAESRQGLGIGRRLLDHVIAEAASMGARRLYLETNRSLGAAIHLYETVGFQHLPPDKVVPSPYARANVYMEMRIGG